MGLDEGRVLYSVSNFRMRAFCVYRLYPASEERLQYKKLGFPCRAVASILNVSLEAATLRLSAYLGSCAHKPLPLGGCDFKSVQWLCSLMPKFILEYSLLTTNEYSMVQRPP